MSARSLSAARRPGHYPSFDWSMPAANAQPHPPSRQPNILTALSGSERALFLSACSERRFAPDEELFTQGEPHTGTYVVIDGLVRTYYTSAVGKEMTLGFWSDGDWVGGPDFFGNSPGHVWSAQTVEESTMLLIAGSKLRQLATQIPGIALAVIDSLTFKLHWMSILLQTLGTESVSHRLAALLVKLAEIYGERRHDGIAIRYPFSQEDLATMVGASRQWVSTAFAKLQRQQIVRYDRRQLVIIDLEKLTTAI